MVPIEKSGMGENGTCQQYRGRGMVPVGNSAVDDGTCRCEHSREWYLEGAMVQENGTSKLWWSWGMVPALRSSAVGREQLERAAPGRLFPSHRCCRNRQGEQCAWDMMSLGGHHCKGCPRSDLQSPEGSVWEKGCFQVSTPGQQRW